jgi:hypothetical protein
VRYKVIPGLLYWLCFSSIADAATPPRMTRLTCEIWLKANASGYVYMVEGYLLGLYRYQSLVGNPTGSFYLVSTKELPAQVQEECKKDPQANVGDIANSIKLELDRKNDLR